MKMFLINTVAVKAIRVAALSIALTIMAGPNGAWAGTTISTDTEWNGTTGVGYWGSGVSSNTTYGQTFTSPTAGILTDFTVYMYHSGGDPQNYKFYLYAWNTATNSTTGSALYTSSLLTAPSSSLYDPVTINSINTPLSPATTYVGIFSTAGVTNTDGEYIFGYVFPSGYTDGNFVSNNNPSTVETTYNVDTDSLAFSIAISN